MTHIVFIDFDGPLYPNRCYLMEENKGLISCDEARKLKLYPHIHYWKMDHMAVGMLNNMAEMGAKFVLSTSWSELHDLPTLENLLRVNGFTGQIHPDWHLERKDKSLNRSQHVKLWLDSHPEYLDKYIMIDDQSSAPEIVKPDLLTMYGLDPKRIFAVDIDNGILMSQYKAMMAQLS